MTKVAIITGSNGGIGQQLCKSFTDNGYHVIGTDVHKSSKFTIGDYVSINLDKLCNNKKYRDDYITKLSSSCQSGLDVLINNAALQIVKPIEKLSFEDWQLTMNVNFNSVFLLVKGLYEKLELNKGCVINISSIHANLSKPGFSSYAASKAGLVGLTKSLAVELGKNIRINAVCPAAIETEMLKEGFSKNPELLDELNKYHPVGKIGSPTDIAHAVLYLADDKSSFINGATLTLDGGISSKLHDPE